MLDSRAGSFSINHVTDILRRSAQVLEMGEVEDQFISHHMLHANQMSSHLSSYQRQCKKRWFLWGLLLSYASIWAP